MTKNKIYVDSVGGSDVNPGTIDLPYASLAKVQTVLKNSLIIYLKKDSVFNNDPLDLSGLNNVIIDSYGSGAKPIMSGLKSITGWTNLGGNIWSHQSNEFSDEITNVFIGGTRALIGRTPLNAYKTATGGSNSTLIDSALTDPDGYWDECELVIRYWDWATGISRASSYINKTFTFPIYYQDEDTGYYYSVTNGKEYFIQNHIHCLTVQNTWAYKPSTKTLYIYSTTEPVNVTANFGEDQIYIESAKHISVKNIDIDAAKQCGIDVLSCSDVKIDAVKFTWSGIYSMLFRNTNGIRLTNLEGYDQNNDFAYITGCANVFIDTITALRCGIDTGACRYMRVFGRGMTGGITAQIIDNWYIRYAEVGYVSYGSINAAFGNKFTFEKCYAHHFNLNKFDGGGITSNTAIRWHLPYRENIYPMTSGRMYKNIINRGNSSENSFGLYVDNFSYNYESAKNFVAGCKWNGILHESIRNHCHDNTFVQENDSDAGISYGMTYPTSKNAVIDNNVFVNIIPEAASFYSISQETNVPNTIKNNKYYYPNGKSGSVDNDSIALLGTNGFSMSEWLADQSRVDWDRTGEEELLPTVNAGIIKPYDLFCIYFINPAKTVKTIQATDVLFDDYMDLDGNYQTYPFDIEPYGHKILTRAPRPVFHNAAYDVGTPNQVTIRTTVKLNSSIVPATSAFTLPAKTVTNVVISENTIILTTAEDYEAGDNFSVAYTKPVSNPLTAFYGGLEMASFSGFIENDYTHVLTATGTGAGVVTLRITTIETLVLTLDGNGKFYDDNQGLTNEGTTRTINGTTGNTLTNIYLKVTSGTSNLVFSQIDKIVTLMHYGTTNCPSMGGSFARYTSLVYLFSTGNNTFNFDISELYQLENLLIYGSNTIFGSIENLVKLHTMSVTGSNTITYPRVIKLKKLTYLIIGTPTVLTSANVNQLLADMWANRDEDKYSTQSVRSITLTGGNGTGAPTGQGLIDKAALQNYRSPFNSPSKAVWTVTTR
jgi:hypothetical protein